MDSVANKRYYLTHEIERKKILMMFVVAIFYFFLMEADGSVQSGAGDGVELHGAVGAANRHQILSQPPHCGQLCKTHEREREREN